MNHSESNSLRNRQYKNLYFVTCKKLNNKDLTPEYLCTVICGGKIFNFLTRLTGQNDFWCMRLPCHEVKKDDLWQGNVPRKCPLFWSNCCNWGHAWRSFFRSLCNFYREIRHGRAKPLMGLRSPCQYETPCEGITQISQCLAYLKKVYKKVHFLPERQKVDFLTPNHPHISLT